MQILPDRTRIFLAAFWTWTWILFWLSRIANYMLYLVLKYIPNVITPRLGQKTPIYILKAMDTDGNSIINKLILFLNLKWDKDMCDSHGGVDLDSFANCIGTSVIMIAYLLEYDLDESSKKLLTESFDEHNFKKIIKLMTIDFSKKIMHKFFYSEDKKIEQIEDILFGEINFF